MTIEENKNNVYQAVKRACENANRSSDDVNIVAVTKYVSSDVAEELVKNRELNSDEVLKFFDLNAHLLNKSVSGPSPKG